MEVDQNVSTLCPPSISRSNLVETVTTMTTLDSYSSAHKVNAVETGVAEKSAPFGRLWRTILGHALASFGIRLRETLSSPG